MRSCARDTAALRGSSADFLRVKASRASARARPFLRAERESSRSAASKAVATGAIALLAARGRGEELLALARAPEHAPRDLDVTEAEVVLRGELDVEPVVLVDLQRALRGLAHQDVRRRVELELDRMGASLL